MCRTISEKMRTIITQNCCFSMDISVYFNCLLLIGAYMLMVFVLGQWRKNNGIVDIFWGLGFVVITLFLLIDNPSGIAYSGWQSRHLVSLAVIIWGVRLATHIAIKNWGQPEDWRYVNFRNDWRKRGLPQWLGALLQVYLLQGLFMFVIALPIIHVHLTPENPGIITLVGALLWMFGFYFESVGDYQKQIFKQHPANKGKILTTGLWKYTRHPNYFGEAVMWWGIWLMTAQLAHPWLTLSGLLSPVILTWLLTKVSGVAMLERKYTENADYQEYIRQTPDFFPRFR